MYKCGLVDRSAGTLQQYVPGEAVNASLGVCSNLIRPNKIECSLPFHLAGCIRVIRFEAPLCQFRPV